MRKPFQIALLPMAAGLSLMAFSAVLRADENLLNYVTGVETQPKGTWEAYQWITQRKGKGVGRYTAVDYKTELEYGLTDRLAGAVYLKGQSIDSQGILIDNYIPKDEHYGYTPSGVQLALKYNFLSPIKDGIGVGMYIEPSWSWKDPHSGQDKRSLSLETKLLLQKNFLDDTLIWLGNLGLESTYARRAPLDGLPDGFEWVTDPEMELEVTAATGMSYRIAPNWYAGVEMVYQSEFETEVNQERKSLFAGPTLHYGGLKWWWTLTWFPQIQGGGEQYPGQVETDLHLIEKTRQEIRLKVGLNLF